MTSTKVPLDTVPPQGRGEETLSSTGASIDVVFDPTSATVLSVAGPATPIDRDAALASAPGGTDLSRFQDEGEIARGGMGTVHRVFDKRLERHEAMKLIDPEMERGMPIEQAVRMRTRFLDEARITGQLDHPNIVPIYDMGLREDGLPHFITMKMIEGETFASYLDKLGEKRLVFPHLERVVDALLKMCDALAFAHSRGVIHCDLKPSNVMVGVHGQVYLMDWGLALVLDPVLGKRRRARLPEPGAILGTPAYMAPEQARGLIDAIDPRTDVFGLGAILYRVLTQRPPHVGPSLPDTVRLARDGVIAHPTQVGASRRLPAELCRICMKALSAEPNDRYQSMGEFRADLEAFQRGGGWLPSRRYPPGYMIIREGEPGDAAYIIVDGLCEVSKMVDGNKVVLRIMGPGEVFGETAVFSEQPRSATVIAKNEVTLKLVTAETLDLELERNAWLKAFVRAVATRFRERDDELAQLRTTQR